MDHLFGALVAIVLWLIGLIGAAIGVIETAARHGLAALGVTGELQTVLLLALLVLLIVAAFRVFARVIATLLAVVLLALLLHALLGPSAAGLRV